MEFAKQYATVGFDINQQRVDEVSAGKDDTLEVNEAALQGVIASSLDFDNDGLFVTSNSEHLTACNFYIITVPTPTNKNNQLILTPLVQASRSVGKVLSKGDYVVYESTVYPGATEEECIPILEKESGLTFNKDFFVGYSPERINPGDKNHSVAKILKVTSGSTPEAAQKIDSVYKSVITAGTYIASSIKVAEAAKAIENSQRDINIAFVNELAKIFNKIGIDTLDVLETAGTKWNFLPFRPGLVGGHCIGVDPYYLAQKAQEVGHHPEIILAGRRINESMGQYIASQVVKLMIQKDLNVKESNVLMLGISFKENCPDIRNSKAIDVYKELMLYDMNVTVFDPWVKKEDVISEYGVEIINAENKITQKYQAIILTVAHSQFINMDIKKFLHEEGVVYDVKSVLPKESVDGRL